MSALSCARSTSVTSWVRNRKRCRWGWGGGAVRELGGRRLSQEKTARSLHAGACLVRQLQLVVLPLLGPIRRHGVRKRELLELLRGGASD